MFIKLNIKWLCLVYGVINEGDARKEEWTWQLQ